MGASGRLAFFLGIFFSVWTLFHVFVHLSHSPLLVREAASRGARLMPSGHPHGGQLWPFTFLSAIPCPFQAGRYEVDGMTIAVSGGTGTWGPPMRLFLRSEIVEVILRT